VKKDIPILDINDIRTIAVPVLIKTPTDKAIVFGSWARGTQTRSSDIDMVIISKKMQVRFFDRYSERGPWKPMKALMPNPPLDRQRR
jgi:predicted nucleotidyltransferase